MLLVEVRNWCCCNRSYVHMMNGDLFRVQMKAGLYDAADLQLHHTALLDNALPRLQHTKCDSVPILMK